MIMSLEMWILYISAWVVVYIMLIWYAWKLLHRPIADIFRKEKNMLIQIGFKRLKKTTEQFKFGDAVYTVDWSKTAWRDQRNRPHLLYLEGEALPLDIGNPKGLKVVHDAKRLNEVAGKNTIEQLVKGALNIPVNNMMVLALVIISFIAGIGIGFIIHYFVMPPPPPAPPQETVFPPLPT